jgi:hypothetical protein
VKNVTFKIEKDELVIRVGLKERHGRSSSGKTEIIATTSGNADIGKDGIKFGLNVFVKAPEGKDK